MPSLALKPCGKLGCKNLTRDRFCTEHSNEGWAYDRYRGSSTQRGYDGKWRKARIRFLALNPICVICLREGKVTAATVVDHIVAHKGNKDLFWDRSNWQAACKPCHDAKTISQDGGAW
jgi:5-methylcytosine-specific restriction enzyme A